MTPKLDHIAIAAETLEAGLAYYRDLLGLKLHETEEVEEQKVRAALLPVGDTRLEILEPTSEESPIARFLAKKGPGLHHLAFEVEDIEAELEKLKKAGARLIDEKPRIGVGGSRIAFVHPKTAAGVLVELVQK
jgi:methylmalonyl-CoA/ethylmalonyl-CoA epimerase